MRVLCYVCLLFVLAACGAPASLQYPIITVNFDLEARARALIENPQPVLEPMLAVRVRENVVQYRGFATEKVDVYDRVEIDIDLHPICLPDGTIGEAQDYVLNHMQMRLGGERIPELGSSLFIENPSGTDYRVQRCDSQETLVLTVTAFVKFGAGIHLGEIELTLRDGTIMTYDFGLEVDGGVEFGE